ncbi:type I pullulanase [Tengunoibacter tsumagoiensis]|uniref:Pullulanase n=1 Tax=Tengunoibacter tsumagoiensis TaxID=2014871 RepID=A0A401ZZD6_9CHLR|nr:type I pullulanase [Tengunoibacter tsumagoiensis]GCE12219.1 pullulanase [Tengunoibacter tsumagoiensis]
MDTILVHDQELHQMKIVNAYLEQETEILVKLSHPQSFPLGMRHVTVMDQTINERLEVCEVDDATVSKAISSTVIGTTLVLITLSAPVPVNHLLQIELTGYLPAPVIPRNVLNSEHYFYAGDDLGNCYSPHLTTFRIWAPTASAVSLLLFESESGPETLSLPLTPDYHGTWYTQVEQNLANWYYLYEVTVLGRTQTVVDPYTRAQAPNATKGMIVDLARTDPPEWELDQYCELLDPVDAVIYETHIRDFSIATNSGMDQKGRYLAFTEPETVGPNEVRTGLSSLQELGITHVHVLPISDFASIDETADHQYNWGYDPRNYNVPQGNYATTPLGVARIIEVKRMIQSLHQVGIGLVMDTVYNHTYDTESSSFNKIVPQYYYRTNVSGEFTNGSGVGNELASERPMVRKFLVDSVKYWVSEYHVDGIRFDLMALLSIETMRQISQELQKINPSVLLYGEAWTGGSSGLPARELLLKGDQKELRVAVFNDTLRNGLSGSVFDRRAQGFVSGASGLAELIKDCVTGSWLEFAAAPSETINYASSHDNMTLWDKISTSNLNDSEADLILMDKLAQAIVFTSQGVPFFQGGEEFLRTKHGNDNSYNAGDKINQLDWSRKAQYYDVFRYYAALIHLRRRHPAFRMTTVPAIKEHLRFLASPANTVAFLLHDHANGDSWKHILVIYNPNREEVALSLPAGTWTLVASSEEIDEKGLGEVHSTLYVPRISCSILWQK